MRLAHGMALVVGLWGAMGCGEKSSNGGAVASSPASGGRGAVEAAQTPLLDSVFRSESYKADDTCRGEGMSLADELEGDTFLFIYPAKVFGKSVFAIATCKTVEACTSAVKAYRENADNFPRTPSRLAVVGFETVVDDDHRRGSYFESGFGSSSCAGAVWAETALERAGQRLSITVRGAQGNVPGKRPDASGNYTCQPDVVRQALEGKPCNYERVLLASWAGHL